MLVSLKRNDALAGGCKGYMSIMSTSSLHEYHTDIPNYKFRTITSSDCKLSISLHQHRSAVLAISKDVHAKWHRAPDISERH